MSYMNEIMSSQITTYGLLGVRKVLPRLPAVTGSHWLWYQLYVHVRLTVTGVHSERSPGQIELGFRVWHCCGRPSGPAFGFEQGRSNTCSC